MNKWTKAKYAVSGFLVGSIFFGSLAFAATQKIEVSMDRLKFFVHKVDVTPTDKNGNFSNQGSVVPGSIIYKGTTYVPLRLMSNLLGEPDVKWEPSTKSIHIGGETLGGKYLSTIAADSVAKNIKVNSDMRVGGTTLNNGLLFTHDSKAETQSYNINGQYKEFSFSYGVTDDVDDSVSSKITVYGDGKELWSSTAVKGVALQPKVIPIGGVLNLEIKVEKLTGGIYKETKVVIINPLLT